MSDTLDWDDTAAVLRWLADLRTAWDDANSVTCDMLAPLRSRKLGPKECRRLYSEASFQLDQLIHFAMLKDAPPPDDDDGGPGDPSGNGGAGPVH